MAKIKTFSQSRDKNPEASQDWVRYHDQYKK